jgi:hypothetical protein
MKLVELMILARQNHPFRTPFTTDQGVLYWISPGRELFYRQSGGTEWKQIGGHIDLIAAGFGRLIEYSGKRPAMSEYDFSKGEWIERKLPIRPRQILPAQNGLTLVLAQQGGLYYHKPGMETYRSMGSRRLDLVRVTCREQNPVAFVHNRDQGRIFWTGKNMNAWKAISCNAIENIDASARCLYASTRTNILCLANQWIKVADSSWEFMAGKSVCYLIRGREIRRFRENRRRIEQLPDAPALLYSLTVDRETDDLHGIDAQGRIWGIGSGSWYELCRVPESESRKATVLAVNPQ